MSYQRILSIQDISCLGQCSLTVALPILSACGFETCILPSAVLSTHTGGLFRNYTFRDLTDDMPAVEKHWQETGIRFDAFYTGYLGSVRQIAYVRHIMDTLGRTDGRALRIVDPAMADNGRLYDHFDASFVSAMRSLCREADVILPNLTEACLLADMPYRTIYDETYIRTLLEKLAALGTPAVVLTGVGYTPDQTGVAVYENGQITYYAQQRIDRVCHGTGDVYASVLVGALMQGKSLYRAAICAADFTRQCIENTLDDPSHWYGVKFEPLLPLLMQELLQ